MKIDGSEGVLLQLSALTKTVTNPDGTTERVTYHRGDPVFDEYETAWLKRFEPSLPRNFMIDGTGKSGASGWKQCVKVSDAFSKYYAGVTGEKELEGALSEIVADFRSAYADQGFDPDEFMPDLLLDVYNVARSSSIRQAYEQGWRDSRPLAAQYNGSDRNTKDTIYYDAKYYYQTEEMKDTLQEITHRIGRRYGVSDLELPTDYADGSLMKEMYSSYNAYVNTEARSYFVCNGNMLDENMVPPKGFKFFYKGNDSCANIYPDSLPPDGSPGPATDDGVLHIWYGDWSFVGRVPVRQDATRYPASVNMFDVVSKRGGYIPDEIVAILKNFDFFSAIQGGPYLKSHPRKLPD